MCKNDRGGVRMLKDNWTTFVKARLNCSISGDYPFYFDEIQSMSYVPDENIVYATFQTPSNSIAGSAICAFNLTAINNAFNGPFKHQEHPGSSWSKRRNAYQSHYECSANADPYLVTETYRYYSCNGSKNRFLVFDRFLKKPFLCSTTHVITLLYYPFCVTIKCLYN